eukprot:gene13717-biopygen23068
MSCSPNPHHHLRHNAQRACPQAPHSRAKLQVSAKSTDKIGNPHPSLRVAHSVLGCGRHCCIVALLYCAATPPPLPPLLLLPRGLVVVRWGWTACTMSPPLLLLVWHPAGGPLFRLHRCRRGSGVFACFQSM